jgi:hypothetical protein
VLDALRIAVDAFAEQALDAVEEVRDVAGDVEADQVAREHAAQELPVLREHAVHVVGGNGTCRNSAILASGRSSRRWSAQRSR